MLASATRLTHLQLDTVWGTREVTKPTLISLHAVDTLTRIVIVFYVGSVLDEIMRSVVGVLEDLKEKPLLTLTFLFKRLAPGSRDSIVRTIPGILSTVENKMRETFPSNTLVKADLLQDRRHL